MKYALCNEMFEDSPLDRVCNVAAECGYKGIELAPFTLGDDVMSITEAQRTTIRRTIEAAGLKTVGLHWLLAKTKGYYLTSPESEVRRRTAQYLGELARLCRDLGGSIMVLGSPFQRNLLPGVSHEEAMQHAADVLRQADSVFKQNNVTLAVEPLGPQEGDFLLTAESGIELINMVDSPNVRLHLDVKAMTTEAIPVPDIIRRYAKEMVHFHANDPNLLGPGMGDVDFAPIFAALRDIDYQGWISVEVFEYSPGAKHIAKASIETMRRCEKA